MGVVIIHTSSLAQVSLTGQIRTRTELRDGQGTLPAKDAKASFFTTQRTRLNLGYAAERFRFLTSVQEVRVWGSDQSTISNLEGSKFFLHQAWGELILSDSVTIKVDNLSVKAGRQEIIYDDSRLLGNLDWLQQARRHDAVVIRFSHKGWIADAGFAFNQNHGQDTPNKSGSLYNGIPTAPVVPGTNGIGMLYKSMQYGYFARTGKLGKASLLFFKDDFQKTTTVENTTTFVPGVNSRVTVGAAVFATPSEHIKLTSAAYYQGNQDKLGNPLEAYNVTAAAAFKVYKFTTNPGFDFLSGNNTARQGKVNRRFDPLYGTPHKFWGMMDYFYAADQFGVDGSLSRSPGLLDIYLKNTFAAKENLVFTLDLHEFYAGNKVAAATEGATAEKTAAGRLGTEIDFVVNYNILKNVNIEAGYATMLGTTTLDLLKAPAANKQNTGQWAYLMLNFAPDFLAKANPGK
ncbi:alginate export family protein [Pontibacter saemangeumensis]|uniref:Alginate export family protein n=2 Tax=Pontibacter saemangeumensis TaxID=1084525 RepID=A0ABP8M6G0_9BACT